MIGKTISQMISNQYFVLFKIKVVISEFATDEAKCAKLSSSIELSLHIISKTKLVTIYQYK